MKKLLVTLMPVKSEIGQCGKSMPVSLLPEVTELSLQNRPGLFINTLHNLACWKERDLDKI